VPVRLSRLSPFEEAGEVRAPVFLSGRQVFEDPGVGEVRAAGLAEPVRELGLLGRFFAVGLEPI
jgi:hypothetical protein